MVILCDMSKEIKYLCLIIRISSHEYLSIVGDNSGPFVCPVVNARDNTMPPANSLL